MLFSSFEFIFIFLPLTLASFLFVNRFGKGRIALAILAVACLIFYGYRHPPYLFLLLGSVIGNFYLGSSIVSANPKYRRVILTVGVVTNLAALGYFKYAQFFLNTVQNVLETSWDASDILLPLAISFFTFQQIAYLVDAYRGIAIERNFLSYLMFVTFFPQLIAGPIVHHSEMMPQFNTFQARSEVWNNIAFGAAIFALGLFKKTGIADTIAPYADEVFNAADAGQAPSFFSAWCGILAYSFQIYFDFSGYSDMAVGIGKMFGINLPLNFFSPYKSQNIIEFWRRWHITLSRFLRDYLYISLGGNRNGSFNRYRNLMLTMLLGGLWHGAGWNFVIWGGLHGSYLAINHALNTNAHYRSLMVPAFIKITVTFLCVAFAWIFFRATTFEGAMLVVSGAIGSEGIAALGTAQLTTAAPTVALLFFAGIAAFAMPNSQQIFSAQGAYISVPNFGTQPIPNRFSFQLNGHWCFLIGSLLAISFVAMLRGPYEFIYFEF